MMVRRKKISPLRSSSHFVSQRPRHSSTAGEGSSCREAHLIEVNQRSREARLRLERVERLIVVVMKRRSLLVPWTGGLAAKLRRALSRSGFAVTALTDFAQ